MIKIKKGDRVSLSEKVLSDTAVTNLGASKLVSRFIGPFRILNVIDDAHTLDIPSSMRLHEMF